MNGKQKAIAEYKIKTDKEIWSHFKNLPGSRGIASEHAIGELIKIIKRKKPKKILELGSGIGTLTYTILASLYNFFGKEFSYTFYTVENNKLCIEQFKKNLKDFKDKYILINDIPGLYSQGIQFDLIVIDAGGNLQGDMGKINIENMVERQGIIFIEGYRRYQREMIKNWYADRDYISVNIRAADRFIRWKDALIKNKGYWLFQFEPTVLQRIRYFVLYLWDDKLIDLRRKVKEILRVVLNR